MDMETFKSHFMVSSSVAGETSDEKVCGDVRSLSIPGNHKEKIGYLGNGLDNFERLKSLNLSHNSLVCIEGLQCLKHLQNLNLYYNCIPSLEEVKVLFELPLLRYLDLRLNPLGKSDPYYRHFLVHNMISLRNLDGCPVKDDERKCAKRKYSQLRSRDNRQAFLDHLNMKLSLKNETNLIQRNHFAANHRSRTHSSSHQKPLTKPAALAQAENKQQGNYRKPLEELLDIMDKHWVGEKNLELNTNFLTQIVQILSMMENHITSQDAEVKTLKEEMGKLCDFVNVQEKEHKAEVEKVIADLEELNAQLRIAMEENVALRKDLLTSEKLQHKRQWRSNL
ncbi:centrosomal protein of 72 kDa [Syngnathus acus]|uniref:centrosomal protein of 72 kDa n=1 Tax=Syngnathus acus TaxID=161584 RepID=UPI0018863940|nr:centrosomal protein of 72 kDa [Syngnathus acus]